MLKNFTVLYVEDDVDTQEYMEFYLSSEVKEFYQAFNGEEGIALYKSKKPDVIITDLNMPKLSGMEMIKQIKADNKEQIIIITSAFGDRESLMEALNNGANGFISKPIDIDAFNSKLVEVTSELKAKIAKSKASQKEKKVLYSLAHFDSLTQIHNRLSFTQHITHMVEEEIPFRLFFIDLDNFKPINDTYGHDAGDAMLKWVVKNISKIIRKDDMFARLGGDEFALVLRDIDDIETLKLLAQKVIDATSLPLSYAQESLVVSCSIGVSCYPHDGTEVESLLKKADEAMYRAKRAGKSNFVTTTSC